MKMSWMEAELNFSPEGMMETPVYRRNSDKYLSKFNKKIILICPLHFAQERKAKGKLHFVKRSDLDFVH